LALQPQESQLNPNFEADYSRLENPYSLAKMKKALKSLEQKDGRSSDNPYAAIDFEETHYYIKFSPKNQRQFDVVKNDTLIEVYRYPLDIENLYFKGFIKDNEKNNKFPQMWCAVRVDYQLPTECPYEILEKLFIPDEMKDNSIGKKAAPTFPFADQLVEEAFLLTGNKNPTITRRSGRWRPAGTIRVADLALGTIGIEGVKVRARRWFTTHTGITNERGAFTCDGRFRNEANYSIDWEKHDFTIYEGDSNGANMVGPELREDWDKLIRITDGEDFYHASIFRAAFHYYHKDIRGLRRPPNNKALTPQLRIKAYFGPGTSVHNLVPYILGLSDSRSVLSIYNPNGDASIVYGTTIHEMAHASHYKMGIEASGGGSIVKESWACGVQWSLTRLVYTNYELIYNKENPDYTGIVQDMIDPISEEESEMDRVTGYTIRQIEDALIGQTSWEDWRDNILELYDNETETHLEALFEYWKNWP